VRKNLNDEINQLHLINSDVIYEGPGRSSPTMESKNIITGTNNIERKVFVIRVSGTYGRHNDTVPEDIYESRDFAAEAAERASLEECDNILLTSNCLKRLCRCEGSR